MITKEQAEAIIEKLKQNTHHSGMFKVDDVFAIIDILANLPALEGYTSECGLKELYKCTVRVSESRNYYSIDFTEEGEKPHPYDFTSEQLKAFRDNIEKIMAYPLPTDTVPEVIESEGGVTP